MAIIHMVAKIMRKLFTIKSFFIVAIIFASFSLYNFTFAGNYGSETYNTGDYSTYTPATGSIGTTQAIRHKFLAEQKALAVAVPAVTPTTPSVSSGFSGVRTLKLKITGSDVKDLQIYLNTHGYVVAKTGAGSIGKESTYFGNLTKQALMKFQKANGLKADGIAGPKTRVLMK